MASLQHATNRVSLAAHRPQDARRTTPQRRAPSAPSARGPLKTANIDLVLVGLREHESDPIPNRDSSTSRRQERLGPRPREQIAYGGSRLCVAWTINLVLFSVAFLTLAYLLNSTNFSPHLEEIGSAYALTLIQSFLVFDGFKVS